MKDLKNRWTRSLGRGPSPNTPPPPEKIVGYTEGGGEGGGGGAGEGTAAEVPHPHTHLHPENFASSGIESMKGSEEKVHLNRHHNPVDTGWSWMILIG
ncbi:hypothetical protein ACOMHN_040363 [Nucella lapillus]